MRIINKLMIRDYVVTFAMTLLIFTFVMCLGAIVKAIDLIARGVSGWVILQAFTYNIPYILTFSIPMSAMTTVLLVFGRMSLDGEITAMRASGLSMWQIISPVILLSILLSGLCVYLNVSVAPDAHFARRQALVNVGIEDPTSLLEEGRFIRDFPGLMVYVSKKDRDIVRDVIVYEVGPDGVKRNVRAQHGKLSMIKDNTVLLIDLYDVRIDQPSEENPLDITLTRTINARHYPVELDFGAMMKRDSISKKMSDMTLTELTRSIRNVRDLHPHLGDRDLSRHRMALLVEANERLAISLSCFAFTLLGIPLGMKSRRRESSVGVGISLVVVFIFYFFIILAEAMVKHPEYHPDLIVWFPVIVAEILGFYMIRRQD